MKMKKSLFLIAISSCLLIASCGKSKNSNISYRTYESNVAMEEALYDMDEAIALTSSKKAVATQANGVFIPAEVPDVYEVERKLIKNGYVNLSIDSMNDIEQKVQTFAKSYGGYITNTYTSENNYSAQIKVPCNYFEDAMNNAGTLGEVKSRSQNANDVTDEYYDLDSRINSKRILKEKLEGYLKKAESIKDLMEIENQLNIVVSDLESMEGRMKRLSNQIDYSTIDINAYLPTGYIDTGYNWPDLKESFRELGVNIVNFFAKFLVFIIYLVIYGLPIVGLVAVLYWLLFGKIGLLVKLFKKIGKK